ncbi:WG repeat-containing protein [Paenibacillus naphthalenovorans]|uniref:WG repeat-containing protein n=1 Tax=Paenibacillus naphthalenovorans TaxID=162209 RepID=UPI003D26F470
MIYASSPKYLPYDVVGRFSDGLALFVDYKVNKVGYIDTSGKVVIPAKFDGADDFSEGLARVSKGDATNEKSGFIDKTGKVVIPLAYEMVLNFSEGMAAFAYQFGAKWGFLDKTGRVAIQPQYDKVKSFSEGLAAVRIGDKWGYIDKTGQAVIPPQFDSANSFSEGLALVTKGGKSAYIDQTGDVVIEINYYQAGDFKEGLAFVSKKGKYGFIDKTGKEVVTPQFSFARNFSEGLAAVVADGLWGFIDKTGKIIIQPQYTEIESDFQEGLAIVVKGKLTGYIDRTGKEVLGFKQNNTLFFGRPFSGGYAVLYDGIRKYYIVANPIKQVILVAERQPAAVSAVPTASKVLVDGQEVAFQAYNINGNNYFKLRDIAMVLNGTEKSFSVGWDGQKNAISLESGKPYEAVGGELVVSEVSAKVKAKLSTSKIYLDGKEIELTVYLINGNYYFKLRDVAAVLDFGVIWDGATNTVSIDSTTGYAEA